jgi:hypothetical protein
METYPVCEQREDVPHLEVGRSIHKDMRCTERDQFFQYGVEASRSPVGFDRC